MRAVRYYEELGLIRPEKRSRGGFRLYGPEDGKRLLVINLLKEMGLSLTEIRDILLAKKSRGGDKETVTYLLNAFRERLKLIEAKIDALNTMKSELNRAIGILRSCERCGHDVLLDVLSCAGCGSLSSTEAVPETLKVIFH